MTLSILLQLSLVGLICIILMICMQRLHGHTLLGGSIDTERSYLLDNTATNCCPHLNPGQLESGNVYVIQRVGFICKIVRGWELSYSHT